MPELETAQAAGLIASGPPDLTTISVGGQPNMLRFAPNGARAYVALRQAGLAVIDTATRTLVTTNAVQRTVPIGRSPVVHAIDEDGARVYVADTGDSGVATTVYVLDTLNNSVLGTIAVGATPADIALGLAPRA